MRAHLLRLNGANLLTGAAAVAWMSLFSIGNANAAPLEFGIVGGDPYTLQQDFNPNWASAPAGSGLPTVGNGTSPSIDIFYSTNASSAQATSPTSFSSPTSSTTTSNGNGLGVENATSSVSLTYTFLGFEAAYTNTATDAFSIGGGTATFTNQTTALNSSFTLTNQTNGLVPFLFDSAGGGYSQTNGTAVNGGPIGKNVAIGFFINQSNPDIAYALLEDIWQGGDADFDDMVVQVQLGSSVTTNQFSTPLPAALPLFATGLGAMGLLGWRRKRKNTTDLLAV
jgi:hypothetical protein